ncbi:MAG: DNA-deoxyinosine glycosylase [Eubacterium sp.]
MNSENLTHSVEAVYDKNSKILILGTFPSKKSRECGFFYGHPQNRFWRVMARICDCDCPKTTDEKKQMLLQNNIALWDVIHSCDIAGSSDSSIKNVVPNDLSIIFNSADIKQVFVNGKKAESLYKRYLEKQTGLSAVCLPSTSPANASWSEDRLFEYWNCKIKNVDL